jgi:NitT/TauT family transport system ATP-binding protein
VSGGRRDAVSGQPVRGADSGGVVIRLDHVDKTYRTHRGDLVHALSDISVDVGENEFVTLVGPSGCGKSTLLKLVSGLTPVSSGTVRVRDTLVREPFPDVGFVFQQAVLLPWRSVLDNVLFSVDMLGLDVAQYRKRAADLLELTGLAGFETKYPRELSGGMQQRVAICRALLPDPSLLLMDEPFGALDAMTREEMGLELLRIWEERRKTILFVTHSIPEAILLADKVIVMTPRPGRIARTLTIDLPRPRTVDLEFDAQFKAYSDEIRDLIFAGRKTRTHGV